MKKSQITRDGSKRSNLEIRYNHQTLNECIKVKPKKRHSIMRRRKNKYQIMLVVVILAIVLMMFIGNHIIKSNERRLELEAYHAEQFEKMSRNESEETYEDTNAEVNEENFKPEETEALIEIVETLPNEEAVIYIETQEILEEPELVFLSCEVKAEYKPEKLAEYKISANGPYEHFVYILSEEDMMNIAKLVWVEARGECYEGKVAVAAVVLNRYFSDNLCFYRSSILDTLVQPAQFAPIWGVTEWDLSNDPDCLKAVEDACKGWDPTREVFSEGALYFYNPDGVTGYEAEIRQNIKIMVIGNHAFHQDFEKMEG